MPWLPEEIDDDNITKTYGNTTWSTLNLPLCDEDYISKEKTTSEERNIDPQTEVREPMTRMCNQGCVTNMVRVEVDLAKHGIETIEETDKIDPKCVAVETQVDSGHGNILFLDMDTANNEMGGVPWKVADGHQSGLIRQTIGLHKGMEESTGPINDITNPKDVAIQENELNGGWPKEGIKDTSVDDIIEKEHSPNREEIQRLGEQITDNMIRQFKDTTHVNSPSISKIKCLARKTSSCQTDEQLNILILPMPSLNNCQNTNSTISSIQLSSRLEYILT